MSIIYYYMFIVLNKKYEEYIAIVVKYYKVGVVHV